MATATQAGPTGRMEPTSPELRDHVLKLGMWMFVATVTMLFAAFSSAYLVRGAGTDWRTVALPSILWLNTAVILLSSLSLEIGRRRLRASAVKQARAWVWLAALLGFTFLAGQLAAWRALGAAGILVPTTPHASFFYVLTGLHGLHLLAGLVVLSIAGMRLASLERREGRPEASRAARRSVELGGIFWHFLAGLWVYLLVLLTFFR